MRRSIVIAVLAGSVLPAAAPAALEHGQMTDDLIAVVDRYRSLQTGRDRLGASPSDAIPVTVLIDAFPAGGPPAHGPSDADAGPDADTR